MRRITLKMRAMRRVFREAGSSSLTHTMWMLCYTIRLHWINFIGVNYGCQRGRRPFAAAGISPRLEVS